MSRIHDRIGDALAADLSARTAWDEAPALLFLYLGDSAPVLRKLDLPDAIWATDRPPYVLARIAAQAEQFTGLLAALAPEGMHGAALRCETWMASGGEPGTEQRSEVMADAMAHKIRLRPDRVECRSIWAVDRAGVTYSAVIRRGEARVHRSISYPDAADQLRGTIPAALDRLVSGLTGVTLPARKG